MYQHSIITYAIVAAAVASTGCSSPDEPAGPATPLVTYHRDIKPIIDSQCVGCHQGGGIGQGTLVSFKDVRARGVALKSVTEDRTMPPWLADGECNDYHGDRSLSAKEIQLIGDWVDSGMAEGTPVDDAATPRNAETEAPGMSRIDHTLRMPADYSPILSPDDYRCFLVDWPESDTSFVTGIGFNPGKRHHGASRDRLRCHARASSTL